MPDRPPSPATIPPPPRPADRKTPPAALAAGLPADRPAGARQANYPVPMAMSHPAKDRLRPPAASPGETPSAMPRRRGRTGAMIRHAVTASPAASPRVPA